MIICGKVRWEYQPLIGRFKVNHQISNHQNSRLANLSSACRNGVLRFGSRAPRRIYSACILFTLNQLTSWASSSNPRASNKTPFTNRQDTQRYTALFGKVRIQSGKESRFRIQQWTKGDIGLHNPFIFENLSLFMSHRIDWWPNNEAHGGFTKIGRVLQNEEAGRRMYTEFYGKLGLIRTSLSKVHKRKILQSN